jgi:glycosyltransferase involved in cell wall biosynthesis
VRVLIFHGYLLRGTGSNVYNASLARALAALGHEVHLVCQDRDPPDLPGVTVHTPEIGGLLPVFVHDEYEGFTVKTFAELTEAELDRYIELNVGAVRELVGDLGGVDAALANHLVMGPVILARAGLRYALKVHGSDLSYTVLPELERWRPYAVEACESANGILVGSGHIAERLRMAVDSPDVNAKVRLGPPGVDVAAFAPGGRERLVALASNLREGGGVGSPGKHAAAERGRSSGGRRPVAPTSWTRDSDRAADAIDWFAEGDGPRVVFVGKLIVSKGLDLLLAAWPLVHARRPDARLLVVGFGALEAAVRRVSEGLARGNLGPLRELAAGGWALEGGETGPLEMLGAFLGNLPDGYEAMAREAAGSVGFAGRLEHDEVAQLVPACDALVFPSTFPEAFGMVAAEAAAAGVLPVSAAHSGAAEVSRELAAGLPDSVRELVSFELGPGAVRDIADRLNRWLELPGAERESAGAALRSTVERLWSWEGVARGVLAASSGDLDGLAMPAAK